jgi:membrane associated rhomboid family serine protease
LRHKLSLNILGQKAQKPYFAFEIYSAVQNAAGDNVARWAHVGGALVGLIIVVTWNKTNKKTFY